MPEVKNIALSRGVPCQWRQHRSGQIAVIATAVLAFPLVQLSRAANIPRRRLSQWSRDCPPLIRDYPSGKIRSGVHRTRTTRERRTKARNLETKRHIQERLARTDHLSRTDPLWTGISMSATTALWSERATPSSNRFGRIAKVRGVTSGACKVKRKSIRVCLSSPANEV